MNILEINLFWKKYWIVNIKLKKLLGEKEIREKLENKSVLNGNEITIFPNFIVI